MWTVASPLFSQDERVILNKWFENVLTTKQTVFVKAEERGQAGLVAQLRKLTP